MQILQNTSKWWQNAWAAFIFFTRLPFWRVYQPPKDAYKAVVEYWPLTGWLTGAVMGAVLLFGSMVMPYPLAVIAAIIVRLLMTGALHEDGLADFIDGFGGGGSDRQRILDIMKDSRIGTYGVAGLIAYFSLLFAALFSMPPTVAAPVILAADPFAKMVAGQIIQMMPYARTEEQSKAHNIYRRIKTGAAIGLAVQGLLPLALLWFITQSNIVAGNIIFVPCVVMYLLYMLINKRLHGYTGDCCGAIFLLTELSVYLAVAITYFNYSAI